MKSKLVVAFDVFVSLLLVSALIFAGWPLINEGMLNMSRAVETIVKH